MAVRFAFSCREVEVDGDDTVKAQLLMLAGAIAARNKSESGLSSKEKKDLEKKRKKDGKTPPLPRASTAIVAKAPPLPSCSHCHRG